MRDARTLLRAAPAVVLAAALAACAVSRDFTGPDGDRRFYEAHCSVCHVPLPREVYTPAEWCGIVNQMAPRAGLTRSQRERVLGYLTAR